MNITQAMAIYGVPDKDRFVCAYPEYQDKRPSTTFFADFTVADCFGLSAIRDTYRRAFKGWKSNVEMFTELVAVLNHKIWQHYETNETYGRLYDSLWREADAYALAHFKGDDLRHFTAVLD